MHAFDTPLACAFRRYCFKDQRQCGKLLRVDSSCVTSACFVCRTSDRSVCVSACVTHQRRRLHRCDASEVGDIWTQSGRAATSTTDAICMHSCPPRDSFNGTWDDRKRRMATVELQIVTIPSAAGKDPRSTTGASGANSVFPTACRIWQF